MERTNNTPEASSGPSDERQEETLISDERQEGTLNIEIGKIVENFLKNEQDLEISKIFSKFILKFIKQVQSIEQDQFEGSKLFDIFEQFNHSLIERRGKIEDSKDTPPTKPNQFEIEISLIEEMIKKAVKDFKIFQFIESSKWNDLREKFCKEDEVNYQCIESLEKLIMFQNLMKLKSEKYKLKKGW